MKKNSTRPVLERCEDRTLLSQTPTITYTLGQIPNPTGFQELSAVLTTDHAVYKVGQTVDMRLTLTNRAHHQVDVSFSVALSALSIRDKAGFVWDELGTGRTSADLTEHIQFNPGASMTFTGQWTATSKGVYSVHSEFDRGASRPFRVIGDPGAVATGGTTHNPGGSVDSPGGSGKGSTNNGSATPPIIYNPVTNPGPKPTPKPVLPPIVKPPVPLPHDPPVPLPHDPILRKPPVHQPPPVHNPTPPIYARGIRPIIRPTLGHTASTTATSTPTTTSNTVA